MLFLEAGSKHYGILGPHEPEGTSRDRTPVGRLSYSLLRGELVRMNSILSWLAHHAWPLWLLVSIVGLCILLLRASAWSREHRLRRKRSGITAETFTAQLQQYGFDPVITATTFRYLQEVQMVPFPVLPGDDLEKDLGLSPEDIDHTVRELSMGLRREYSPGLQPTPLVTVEDLIRRLQAQPRIAETGVA
jgi:hypothetical protein